MDLHPELVETLVTTQDVLKRRPGSFHSLTDKATLVFSGQQIESLGSFAGYAKSINRFKKWDLSQNYIPEIPDDLAAASKVEDICLAENMLKSMKGFSGNQFLKVLDLSTNHISKIEYLDNLPELRILKLSSNQITRLEGLDLPLLESLDLSHNNLERLENMDRLISLKVLDISRNKIADVDYLLVLGPTKLAELEASYNRMPVSYLDQLLVIVTELKNLRKVTFAGNELALNKFYRVKLSSVSHLTHLDSLVIKDYARRGLKELKQADEIDKLVLKTNMDYIDRMKAEEHLKNQVLSALDEKKKQIEKNFLDYVHVTEHDQLQFLKWAREHKADLNKPDSEVARSLMKHLIKVWRNQVHEQEHERRVLYDRALNEQRVQSEKLLEARVLGTKLKDKLYQISMDAPTAWRELKRFELGEIEQEEKLREQEAEKGSAKDSDPLGKSDKEEIDALEMDMKYDAAKAATKSILRADKTGIIGQQDEAARKIGKAAKVKFDLGPGKINAGDSIADEYLDLMNRQGRIKADYQPDDVIAEVSKEQSGENPDMFYKDDPSRRSKGNAQPMASPQKPAQVVKTTKPNPTPDPSAKSTPQGSKQVSAKPSTSKDKKPKKK